MNQRDTHIGRVNYPDLDIMKLVMAFLVVEIHTRPLVGYPIAEALVEGLEVVAVPFFFIASAFLCFRGLSTLDFETRDAKGCVRVRKTTFKLLRLYLTWTVLFLPVTVFGDILMGKGVLHDIASFLKGTLLIGENFCSWPLWYLLASVVAFALVYLCLRGGVSPWRIVCISAAFLFAGYLIKFAQGWSNAPAFIALPMKIYTALFENTRNGLFEGFFYVAVGALLGFKHERLRNVPVLPLLGFVLVGFLGCIFINGDAHLPFCACASICVFLLSIRRNGVGLRPHVAARNMSTIVYLVHMFFVVLFVYGICGGTSTNVYANEVDRILLYFFALCGSLLFAAIIIQSAKRVPLVKRVFGI